MKICLNDVIWTISIFPPPPVLWKRIFNGKYFGSNPFTYPEIMLEGRRGLFESILYVISRMD